MNQKYIEAMELINKSNSIYIASHINPDGDAIGSTMSMYLALKNMGKDVHVILPKHSDRFNFLDELKYAEKSIDEESYDLLIILDVSSIDRIAITEEEYNKAKKKLVIDHHQNPKIEADYIITESDTPAACQIVYEFLEGNNVSIDSNIAKYIYLGMLTDTGNFNYQNTNPRTHRIVANLLETGIDFAYICKMINDTMKEERLKLIAYVINHIETYKDGKIKYAKVTNDVFESFGINEEDAEGIVNYLRCIKGVDIAIFAKQTKEGTYKVSLRSNGNVDVSKAAMQLGGGGHINASGFTVNGEIDNVKNEIIELVGVNL